MSKPIKVKIDNRFKDGNIKKMGNELRGNAETVDMRRMTIPSTAPLSMQLNPPIVVSRELGNKIKEMES